MTLPELEARAEATDRAAKAAQAQTEGGALLHLEDERRKRIPGSPAWIRIGGGK